MTYTRKEIENRIEELERLNKIEWMKDCSCEKLRNDYKEMVEFFEKVGK